MEAPIKVSYQSTNSAYRANQFLQEISQHSIFAADFEVAIKYTPAELEAFKEELETNPTKRRRIELEAKLAATALDHPSHCQLTHCSIAISESEAYVFILDNSQITRRILNYLVTTPLQQVWHNASFDFRHLHYQTGQFPIFYEDTQIFAKTIVNHVDVNQALTGLKQMAGHRYGQWGLSSDNFDLSHMYDETMLLYAATDACACYYLWGSINRYLTSTTLVQE
jgi:hypothetical protein